MRRRLPFCAEDLSFTFLSLFANAHTNTFTFVPLFPQSPLPLNHNSPISRHFSTSPLPEAATFLSHHFTESHYLSTTRKIASQLPLIFTYIYMYIYRVPCFNSHTLDPSLVLPAPDPGMTAATQQTDDSARQKKRKRALFARAYVTRLYNYESVLPH